MEASTATHAARSGLLARRPGLLRLQKDERLIALLRAGHERAFEILFDRYHARLLAFCRSMLRSQQDAEDVLQEVFVNAHAAILADQRPINVRPWLYRIARNRCLNHLRKPAAEGQDSMDVLPHAHGKTTVEQVEGREELRTLLSDVKALPETQRSALCLREIDHLSYDEIAEAMDTTIPSVKSLLVRARIGLAEASEARLLTCDEVRLTLAEAAEGVGKASGAARRHVRGCEGCAAFRKQLRDDKRALAAVLPVGPLALLKGTVIAKLTGLLGGSAAPGGAVGAGVSGGAAGSGAAGAAAGASAAAGMATAGAGAVGSAIGAKTAAGLATAALLTAGVVEVGQRAGEGTATTERAAGVPDPGPDPRVPERLENPRVLAAASGAAAPRAGSDTEPTVAATAPEADPAAEPEDVESGVEPAPAESGRPAGGTGSASGPTAGGSGAPTPPPATAVPGTPGAPPSTGVPSDTPPPADGEGEEAPPSSAGDLGPVEPLLDDGG